MLVFLVAASLASPGLTEGQVLEKVRNAYAAVKTLSVTATVKMKDPDTQVTTKIWYQQPGNLRVIGGASDDAPFDLLITGGKTTLKAFNEVEVLDDPSLGIASITGISLGTGTLVPALLMKTNWGSPALKTAGARATPETHNGSSTYVLNTPFGKLWVDAKTYFVLRETTNYGPLRTDVRYSPTVANKPLPPGTFIRK